MQNDTTMNRLVPRPTPRAAIAWPLRLAGVVAPWLGLAACGSARVKCSCRLVYAASGCCRGVPSTDGGERP